MASLSHRNMIHIFCQSLLQVLQAIKRRRFPSTQLSCAGETGASMIASPPPPHPPPIELLASVKISVSKPRILGKAIAEVKTETSARLGKGIQNCANRLVAQARARACTSECDITQIRAGSATALVTAGRPLTSVC